MQQTGKSNEVGKKDSLSPEQCLKTPAMLGLIFIVQKGKRAESLKLKGWEVGLKIPVIEPEENRKKYFLFQCWFGWNLKKYSLAASHPDLESEFLLPRWSENCRQRILI